MTLYRQLLIFIFVLFLSLFSGTLFVKLEVTRSFLEIQLESHAQDTATSLGLSIAPYTVQQDMATIETMMNAIFDHGYYQSILLVDLHKTTLIDKTIDVVIHDVPAWFIDAVSLAAPEAEVLVTADWRQMGYLYVKSHPGYAYKSLWEMVLNVTKMYGFTWILVMLIGTPIMRYLFSPLRQVEAQAEALCKRQYSIQEKLPKTRELRQVVVAMNTMIAKVRKMFDEQADIADRLRKNVYRDDLTGLGNRRFLESQVKAGMRENAATVKGALLLAEVQALAELNHERGYHSGDILLRMSAEVIQQATSHYVNCTTARTSGGGFAVFLPDVTEEDSSQTAAEIANGFASLAVNKISHSDNVGHVGGICYEGPVDIGKLFSEADCILRAIQNSGNNKWKVESFAGSSTFPRGEQEWRKLFDRLLANKEIVLLGQKVGSCKTGQENLHIEILSRISVSPGEMLNADIFIPLAERLKCIAAIDKIVVGKAIDMGLEETGSLELAINISSSSLKDPTFLKWVVTQLKKRSVESPAIVFEFAEFNTIRELNLVLEFSKEVKTLGCFVGIDHFGKSFHNFGYLNSLNPKYVKIDRAFTEEIEVENNDSLFFIGALTGVAHSLDILVIAEGVETKRQFELLCDLNIDAVQGYYLDRPRGLQQL